MKKLIPLILASFITFTMSAVPGYMGIYTANYAKDGIKGVRISDIIENSAAEQIGLKENDIITLVDKQEITGADMLIKTITAHQVKDKVEVTYIRNGVTYTTNIVLGEKPQAIYFKIIVDEKAEGVYYTFTDEKVKILMNSDGKTPKSVVQTMLDGSTKSWSAEKSSVTLLYEQFAGVQDKISALIKLIKQQGTCNCHCKNYNFPFYKIDKKTEHAAVKTAIVNATINVFPNPTSGKFTLDFTSAENGTASIIISDVNGKIVHTQSINTFDGKYNQVIDLYGQAKGVYIVTVKIDEKSFTKKVVLQ